MRALVLGAPPGSLTEPLLRVWDLPAGFRQIEMELTFGKTLCAGGVSLCRHGDW